VLENALVERILNDHNWSDVLRLEHPHDLAPCPT
jgi:hypothetical protein